MIADSRGPVLGALAMTAVGMLVLTVRLWQERLLRIAVLVTTGLAVGAIVYLVGSGNAWVAGVLQRPPTCMLTWWCRHANDLNRP